MEFLQVGLKLCGMVLGLLAYGHAARRLFQMEPRAACYLKEHPVSSATLAVLLASLGGVASTKLAIGVAGIPPSPLVGLPFAIAIGLLGIALSAPLLYLLVQLVRALYAVAVEYAIKRSVAGLGRFTELVKLIVNKVEQQSRSSPLWDLALRVGLFSAALFTVHPLIESVSTFGNRHVHDVLVYSSYSTGSACKGLRDARTAFVDSKRVSIAEKVGDAWKFSYKECLIEDTEGGNAQN